MWKRLVTTSVWVVPVLAAHLQETEFGLEQSSGTQGKRSETQIDALERDLDSIEESGGVSFKSNTRRGAVLDIEGYGHFAAAEAGSLATKPTVAAENALRGVAGLASLTLQHDRTLPKRRRGDEIRFQQQIDGVEVRGASVKVFVHDGRITGIDATIVDETTAAPFSISKKEAVRIATEALRIHFGMNQAEIRSSSETEVHRLYMITDRNLAEPFWEIMLSVFDPSSIEDGSRTVRASGPQLVQVNAVSGEARVRDDTEDANTVCTAKNKPFNPIVNNCQDFYIPPSPYFGGITLDSGSVISAITRSSPPRT